MLIIGVSAKFHGAPLFEIFLPCVFWLHNVWLHILMYIQLCMWLCSNALHVPMFLWLGMLLTTGRTALLWHTYLHSQVRVGVFLCTSCIWLLIWWCHVSFRSWCRCGFTEISDKVWRAIQAVVSYTCMWCMWCDVWLCVWCVHVVSVVMEWQPHSW